MGAIASSRVIEPIAGVRVAGGEEHGAYLDDLAVGRKEPTMARLLQRAARDARRVVDGGAYLGFYSLLAARSIDPRGSVLAFEPNPRTFAHLCQNVAANLARCVHAFRAGLGARSGRRTFWLDTNDGSKSSFFRPRRSAGRREARCLALDALLPDGEEVDVVKLDLEGGEVDALRGMRSTLARSPAVHLFVECNPSALERAGSSAVELLAELQMNGFRPRLIDEHQGRLVGAESIGAIEGHANLHCRRAGLGRT